MFIGSRIIITGLLLSLACLRAADGGGFPALPPQGRGIFLDAASSGESRGGADGRVSVVSGKLVSSDADSVSVSGGSGLILKVDRHRSSSAVLRFALKEGLPPGEYALWTRFTQGGEAKQSFRIRAGAAPDSADERLVFEQTSRSWESVWREAPVRMAVFDTDRVIDVSIDGKATQQKNIGGFFLVKSGDLPPGSTVQNHRDRHAVYAGYRPAKPGARLFVVEGGGMTDCAVLFRMLAADTTLPKTLQVEPVSPADAVALAARLNIAKMPTVVLTTPEQAIRAGWSGVVTDALARRILKAAGEVSSLPVVRPVKPAKVKEEALVDGEPAAWLTLGTWAGPAGLSLWGLDYEPQVRPNPGDTAALNRFDASFRAPWSTVATGPGGMVALERLANGFVWPKGSGYAHLYMRSDKEREVDLHISHTGTEVFAWANGEAAQWHQDGTRSAVQLPVSAPVEAVDTDLNDQGGKMAVSGVIRSSPPQASRLTLRKGWNHLLLKLVMRQNKGELFAFRAKLTDPSGGGLSGVTTAVSDPEPCLASREVAARWIPGVYTNAPFNLAHAGEPLTLRVELGRLDFLAKTASPYWGMDGKLELRVTDYDGREILKKEATATFPAVVTYDLGPAPARGYYATHLRLLDSKGNLVMDYPPDGFSVIGGTAAQRARKDAKKMAVTYYFMASNDMHKKLYFPYMERMGILRNIGGMNGKAEAFYKEAASRGLLVAADMWSYRDPTYVEQYVAETAPYLDVYKSFNEIDIVKEIRGTPESWVRKARQEYEIIKRLDPGALMLGGSLVRPASDTWFEECLKLGLADYHDAWDVHCYPQRPPVLEGTMANSQDETEQGVLKVYKKLGMENTKPFWIGETGARCSHGYDARRWQADMVAKMTACALSRDDFQKIGFLIPWSYSRERLGLGDIEAGHMPAEAAYYTASALVDGFPYMRIPVDDSIQAARFGPTTMVWTTGTNRTVSLPAASDGQLVVVDVVGRVADCPRRADGLVDVAVSDSPVYLLLRKDYERLTAH